MKSRSNLVNDNKKMKNDLKSTFDINLLQRIETKLVSVEKWKRKRDKIRLEITLLLYQLNNGFCFQELTIWSKTCHNHVHSNKILHSNSKFHINFHHTERK